MYLVRVPLFSLVFAVVVTACDRDRAPAPAPVAAPAQGSATALDSNTHVLNARGRCRVDIDIKYSDMVRDSEVFEGNLKAAIQNLEVARAHGQSIETVVDLAHRVRRAYSRLITKWYRPYLELTNGPFRCRAIGRQYLELSTDDLFKNVPGYTSYVESLRHIPEKPKSPGMMDWLGGILNGTNTP